jgi:hypothetical protein
MAGAAVEIPDGALTRSVTIRIAEALNPPVFNGDSSHVVVDLTPEGLTFERPVKVSLPWPAGTSDPAGLKVFAWEDSLKLWRPLPTLQVDSERRTITCQTIHFSKHAVYEPAVQIVPVVYTGCDNRIAVTVSLRSPLSPKQARYPGLAVALKR